MENQPNLHTLAWRFVDIPWYTSRKHCISIVYQTVLTHTPVGFISGLPISGNGGSMDFLSFGLTHNAKHVWTLIRSFSIVIMGEKVLTPGSNQQKYAKKLKKKTRLYIRRFTLCANLMPQNTSSTHALKKKWWQVQEKLKTLFKCKTCLKNSIVLKDNKTRSLVLGMRQLALIIRVSMKNIN